MAKVAIQGGVDNYLGKQPEVQAPRKWKSSPYKPETELAYITEAEKNLILKANIHGGLEKGPNMGPSGIMSLDSFGDAGGGGAAGGDTDAGGGYDGDKFGGSKDYDYSTNISTAKLPPGVVSGKSSVKTKEDKKKAKKEAYDFRKSKYAQGYEPVNVFEKANFYNTEFQKRQNIKLAQKRALQKYQDIEQYVDLMDDYGLSAEQIAAEVAANPSYGYDFSDLEKGLATLTSNKGTLIESTRPNLYDVNSKLRGRFSILNPAFNKFRPDTQVTALNTLQKARDYNTLAMDPNISREKLEALANRGKTPEQINPRDGGDNQPYLLPIDYNTGAATTEDIVDDKEFAYRFGTGQNVGADVLRGYVANGGRITRAGGGIMNAVPRQGYFLGKIVKGVGKAIGSVADAAGKVLKSDLGKAAVLAAGYYYGGGNLFGLQRAGASGFGTAGGFGLSGLRDKVAGNEFFSKMLMNKAKTGFNPFKVATAFSPLLAFTDFAKAPVDQMPGDDGMRGGRLIDPLTGEEGTPASMRANIENAKIEAGEDPDKLAALNQAYNNMLFTNLPYAQYGLYANGGRIAKAEGGLMDLGGMEKDYRAEGGFVL